MNTDDNKTLATGACAKVYVETPKGPVELKASGLPLPIIHSDWEFPFRKIDSALLDEIARRQMDEIVKAALKFPKTIFQGVPKMDHKDLPLKVQEPDTVYVILSGAFRNYWDGDEWSKDQKDALKFSTREAAEEVMRKHWLNSTHTFVEAIPNPNKGLPCGLKEIPKETPKEVKMEGTERDQIVNAVVLLDDYIKDAGTLHPRQFDRLDAVRTLLKAKAAAPPAEKYLLYWAQGDAWLYCYTLNGFACWSRDLTMATEYDTKKEAAEELNRLKGLEGLVVTITPLSNPKTDDLTANAAAVSDAETCWALKHDDYVYWNGDLEQGFWSLHANKAQRYPNRDAAVAYQNGTSWPVTVKPVKLWRDADGNYKECAEGMVAHASTAALSAFDGKPFWVIRTDGGRHFWSIKPGLAWTDDRRLAVRYESYEDADSAAQNIRRTSGKPCEVVKVFDATTPAPTPAPQKAKKYVIFLGRKNYYLSKMPEHKDAFPWMYTSASRDHRDYPALRFNTQQEAEASLKRCCEERGFTDNVLIPANAAVEEVDA